MLLERSEAIQDREHQELMLIDGLTIPGCECFCHCVTHFLSSLHDSLGHR